MERKPLTLKLKEYLQRTCKKLNTLLKETKEEFEKKNLQKTTLKNVEVCKRQLWPEKRKICSEDN